MKKIIFTLILVCACCVSHAQHTLSAVDIKHLTAIGVAYSSSNSMLQDEALVKTIDSLRTPALSHLVDALLAMSRRDTSIFNLRFLARPSEEEMVWWYVIREIHYNRKNDKQTPRPDSVVTADVLSRTIDPRWLLDNYYYRVLGGLGFLFNTADLSQINIEIDKLGLRNTTEEAIFFLNIVNTLVGSRFLVLNLTKKSELILNFANKMPYVNGKPYYYFTNFDYEDFEWIGYDKIEYFNQRHINEFYSVLLAHINAAAAEDKAALSLAIYTNSICVKKQYFKYSKYEKNLKMFYKKFN